MRMVPLALTAAVALSACSQEAQQPEPDMVTFNDVMLKQIDEPADALWDVANAAIGDEGGIDPARMDDAKWDRLAMLAGRVKAGADAIAAMEPVKVARDGVKIGDEDIEGGHTAAQVQAAIDRDPALLRELANSLGGHMTELEAAAKAHDAARAGPLVDQLDGVCESCHLRFWYPEQREMVERYQREGVIVDEGDPQ